MFREARSFAQGHTDGNRQSLDSGPDSSVPESTVLTRQHNTNASSPAEGTTRTDSWNPRCLCWGEMLDFQVTDGEGDSERHSPVPQVTAQEGARVKTQVSLSKPGLLPDALHCPQNSHAISVWASSSFLPQPRNPRPQPRSFLRPRILGPQPFPQILFIHPLEKRGTGNGCSGQLPASPSMPSTPPPTHPPTRMEEGA